MKIRELLCENDSIVDAHYLDTLAKKIHRSFDDFSEGDLTDRIYWFDQYKLIDLPLSKLDLNQYSVDDDIVDDYINHIKDSRGTMPPIIYDPIAGSVIDGIHRANAYASLKYNTIPAYVGTVKSSSYGERENEL